MFKNYELLDHTADIGIRVKASSLKDLFRNAGLALTAISTEKQKIINPEKHKIIITQKAANVEELLVNWLNELLSAAQAEGLVFEDIRINEINEQLVDAVAVGASPVNYKTNFEIKAATYHQLKVRKSGSTWQAEVIFDV
ncbi:MAG: archease [Candidatus Omnitrophota bacterium]